MTISYESSSDIETIYYDESWCIESSAAEEIADNTIDNGDYSEEEIPELRERQFPLVPRPYQWEALDFMKSKKRVLNRDSMGLGKTLCGAYASVGRTLVVCPNYLTEHWYNWLHGVSKGRDKHEPYAPYGRQRVVWCQGTFWEKAAALEQDADFTIINMEAFASHRDFLKQLANNYKWQTLIVDEAHHFRTHNARRSETMVEVARCAEYVYLLTGSPIWKEVDDLFMLFRALQPEIFTSYYHFVDQFCIADETRYGTRVLGVKKDQTKDLDKLLKIMSIGHSYSDAGRDLPDVIEKVINIQFPDEIMKAYNEMCAGYRMELSKEEIKFENFAQIMRMMRLMTAFPGKLDAAESIIEDIHDSSTKAVIFTWYRETCEDIAKRFGVPAIHGGITDVSERRRIALESPIVCATLASLSEGIDLSDARTVIYLEENYTPGSMEQSLGRVRRDRQGKGNTDPILLYYIHVKNTIDKVIHEKQRSRGVKLREILEETLRLSQENDEDDQTVTLHHTVAVKHSFA